VTPGAGAAIAAFVAYQQSRAFSKTPELYGTGHPEGLIAPESANNGVTAGTLIPLLVLGIPGGATAAIMLVVMQYQGVNVGPRLFMEQPELGYGIFMAMFTTYLLMALTILPMSRYMSRVTLVSTTYMSPLIIGFTLIGSFVPREYMFDMYLAFAFGILGYIARKIGYHVAAILIGVILGPLMETYMLVALQKSDGNFLTLFSSTLGNILWAALALSLLLPVFMTHRKRRRETVFSEGEG
jgi:putative tricarboxylic transport membrane protein